MRELQYLDFRSGLVKMVASSLSNNSSIAKIGNLLDNVILFKAL